MADAFQRSVLANYLAKRNPRMAQVVANAVDPIAQQMVAAGGGAAPTAKAASRPAPGGGGGGGYGNAFHPGSPVLHKGPRKSDHQTANLPGYPAFDYMAPAGSTTVAPVSGRVIRLSGHNPANGPTNGPHGPFGYSAYIRGDDGKTYFLTHMGSRTVRPGQRVRQGQRIGSVGNYAKWGGANHIHMGVHG